MTDTDGAVAEGGEENQQLEVAEGEGEEWAEPIAANSLGLWDGTKFYLRSFAIWYRWRSWQSQQALNAFDAEKPESGFKNGVYFEQTMGRMVLWFELNGKYEGLTENDIAVDMSCWEIVVSPSTDGKPGKRGAKKIDAISGETWKDIRRKASWWQIFEEGESEFPGRWLMISLAKLEHRSWNGPWYETTMNFHKKQVFGWTPQMLPYQMVKVLKSEEENLANVPMGEPQEAEKELTTGILPEQLCSGMEDDNEDFDQISVLLHLDEATLELATGMVPLEELFNADVAADGMDVYLRYDGLGLCSGQFVGKVIPEQSAWEVVTVRRKLPKDSDIKCPAFYNQALRITLQKAPGHKGEWGHAFTDCQMPQCEPPRERESWTDRVQRALCLSPAAPMSNTTKTERALKMVTKIDTWQDSVLGKAFILFHIEERFGEMCFRYKVDYTSFFVLKVGEKQLEVRAKADAEYRMCTGRLGGSCLPDKTTYELIEVKDSPEQEHGHAGVQVGLLKAPDSKGEWEEVFSKMEPWEVTDAVHKSLVDDPPPEMGKAKMALKEADTEEAATA